MRTLFILFMGLSGFCLAQSNSISLDSCVKMAKINYPQIKLNSLTDETKENNIRALNKDLLPKLNFLSQSSFQSEVTQFKISGFKIPEIPKDQYINALQFEQVLFDAGRIKSQKNIERLNSENEKQKNEIELYKLIDRINQMYSSILFSRAGLNTLEIYKDDIKNKTENIKAGLANGLVLQSSLDELEAEELKTDQSVLEISEQLESLYLTLGQFINKTLDKNTLFQIEPIGGNSASTQISRPEIKWFDTQKNLLDARHSLQNKASLPYVSLFGEGVYGRPGYNFLDQNMRVFGKAGISIKWNIGNLYKLSTEKQSLAINKQMVDIQKEVFEFNLKATLNKQNSEIKGLNSILDKDKSIIEKRHNISLSSASQLENGSITSTEYLSRLNAEMQAVLNQKVHEIKLMNAITNYNATKGINNF